jgi:hypothetical protein
MSDYVFLCGASNYGLPEASHVWAEKFSACLRKIGFQQTDPDPSLFVQLGPDGEITTIALVHADDVKIVASPQRTTELVDALCKLINITVDYAPTKYLGLDFKQDRDDGTISVSATEKLTKLAKTWQIESMNGPAIPRPGATQRAAR